MTQVSATQAQPMLKPTASYPWINAAVAGEATAPNQPKQWMIYGGVQLSSALTQTGSVDVQLIGITQTLTFSVTIPTSTTFISWKYYGLPSWATHLRLLSTPSVDTDSRLVRIDYAGPSFQLLIPNHENSEGVITKFTERSQAPIQMIGYGDVFRFTFTKLDGNFTQTYTTTGVTTSSLVCAFGPAQNWSCPTWPNDLPNGKYNLKINVSIQGRLSYSEERAVWMGITYTHLPLIVR